MTTKSFHFVDIFKAWSQSFRLHRMIISAIAVILSGLIGYLLFEIPLLVMGSWHEYLLSFFTTKNTIALAFISLIFFIARMCIAFSVRREVVDDKIFVGWKDVMLFLRTHIKTVIFYILGWIFLFAVIALGQLFFYAIGAIPYVGSLWTSILYIIPYLLAIFAVLSAVVLFFSHSFGAVILGVEQKNAMDTIIDLYHLVKDKGIYLIVSETITAIVGIIASAFVIGVLRCAMRITTYGAAKIMGAEFSNITLPSAFNFLYLFFPCLKDTAGIGGYYTIPGFFLSLNLIAISAIGIAYFFTYKATAETFIYLSTFSSVKCKNVYIDDANYQQAQADEATETAVHKDNQQS